MDLVLENDQLIPNREYWVRDKTTGTINIAVCGIYDNWKYVNINNSDKFWAKDTNSQALKKWDIAGPIPERIAPDFDKFIKAKIKWSQTA